MKIYISGKITGLPFDEVETKFQNAEWLLEDLDVVPVNPLKNGLTKEHSWNQHMVRDIEMLFECDGILMLDNWSDSVGAGIECDIAKRTGKVILFEVNVAHSNEVVSRIQDAIHEMMGLKFSQYTTKSRKRDLFFARMLFVYHCRQECMKLTSIAKYVHRDHTSMLYLLKKYEDETKYNPAFRELAKKVDNILNRGNNEA
jgi:chromosomal replication initiation ATPase DnaA